MGDICSKCCGSTGDDSDQDEQIHIRHTSPTGPITVSPESRRKAALEAAEKRKSEEQGRGFQGTQPSSEFERLRMRQEKIARAEEEAIRAGGFGKAPLSWQVN